MANIDENFPKWSDISKVFWSDLSSRPFDQCIDCQRNLLDDTVFYFIEKGVQGFQAGQISNTIFEYAICLECAQGMRTQLSAESLSNIQAYYSKNVDFKKRRQELSGKSEEEWLENCLIHKKPSTEAGECQLYAFCNGDQMLYQEFPYMIRGEALDELVDLISAETMDELDDFKNNLTSGPPELRELLEKGGPRIFV